MKLWRNSAKKLVLNDEGKVWVFKDCPCDCEPKIIASQTVNGRVGSSYPKCFDLTPYQGDYVGIPNSKYRLIETGACVTYQIGNINENGKLVGLRDKFCSNYSYNGYMELQQGCIQADGKIKWPGRCI